MKPRPAGVRRSVVALLAGAGLLAAACAPLPAVQGERLAGRIAIRVDGQPDRSFSAGFELAGDARDGELLLTTPLGTAAAQARWRPGEATVRRGDELRRFADLDALSEAALGEPLPMAALFDWLRGRPWAQAASLPRADGGAGFVQLGWSVDLARWSDGAVVAVRREPPPALEVRVRLDKPAS